MVMKFFETHFEEYIHANAKQNLHPKLEKLYEKFPDKIQDLKNLIFYGPSGIGKYTQMLRSIKKYSPSELKYERKITITYNKNQYFFKVSDIHYEIDVSLLGCNSKLFWHEIYQQIVDIISAKTEKCGIIVCKNFHEIHSELLDNFYSYMQQNTLLGVNIKYILISNKISFLPDNIINCCEIIHVNRPSKSLYQKCVKTKIQHKTKMETVSNIKLLHLKNNEELMMQHKIICNKIIRCLVNMNELHFLKFRETLYDIFIYNLDMFDCVWYILEVLMKENHIQPKDISNVLIKTFCFFKYYNNNYRPIYHVENYFLYLLKVIHKL